MQIGGIEESSHNTSHQVTNCIHQNDTEKKETGGMRASFSASSDFARETQAETAETSLLDMLRNTLTAGKKLLGRIWGTENGDNSSPAEAESAGDGTRAQQAGADPVALPDEDVRHNPRIAAASTAVQQSQSGISNNPYFTTSSDPGKLREPFSRRIRIRFRDITEQMAKRFGGKLGGRFGGKLTGRFSGKNAADSGREKPKEDLRKRSRYKEDDIEIDCVLTDDSYLLDSYDRNGEYSTLTTDHSRRS
jgi:hypothetical protein